MEFLDIHLTYTIALTERQQIDRPLSLVRPSSHHAIHYCLCSIIPLMLVLASFSCTLLIKTVRLIATSL